jgi:hypothetical protein
MGQALRHVAAVFGVAFAATVLTAACSPATHTTASNTPDETPTPSVTLSLATALPTAPGTTFLTTEVGKGTRSLLAIPAPGDVNIVISCIGARVDIERAPDVNLVMTCNGLAQLVGLKATVKNAQPLRLVADDSVSWAINASMG